jgi:hypothetical protein
MKRFGHFELNETELTISINIILFWNVIQLCFKVFFNLKIY